MRVQLPNRCLVLVLLQALEANQQRYTHAPFMRPTTNNNNNTKRRYHHPLLTTSALSYLPPFQMAAKGGPQLEVTRVMSVCVLYPRHPLYSLLSFAVLVQPLHVIGVQTETPVAWSHDGDRYQSYRAQPSTQRHPFLTPHNHPMLCRLAFVNGSRSICILEHSEPDALNRALFHVVRMLPGHTSKVNVLTFHPT